MPNFGHSKFLPVFSGENCWKNFEWPFLAIFGVLKDWKKFGMAKIRHLKFIQTLLVQKDWKKFGMAKIWHFKFIQTFFGAKRLEEIRNGQN